MADAKAGQREVVSQEQIIEAPQSTTVAPKQTIRTLTVGQINPSVNNTEYIVAKNPSSLAITNFTGGAPGQHLYIKGDGFTTLVHGGSIFNFAATNLLLEINKVYHYVAFQDTNNRITWHQV